MIWKANIYAKQYADSTMLRYLIADRNYWFMKTGKYYQQYENNGAWYDVRKPRYTTITGIGIITDDGISFLKNYQKITDIIDNKLSDIQNVKVVSLGNNCTCLYIDCVESEYLIRVYGSFYRNTQDLTQIKDYPSDWARDIEMYKLYNAKDFLNIISSTMDEMNVEKPVYTAEAESLQSEGLLRGNEKGLDLLKPLTRIEATAMLVRAMGYEDIPTSGTSYFADIQSDNWGAKYANIAKDKGIAAGVGDGKVRAGRDDNGKSVCNANSPQHGRESGLGDSNKYICRARTYHIRASGKDGLVHPRRYGKNHLRGKTKKYVLNYFARLLRHYRAAWKAEYGQWAIHS